MFGKKIKYEVIIEGMKCENCAKHTKEALLSIKDISKVEVDLKNKKAIISSKKEIDNTMIKNTIEELGYSVNSINMI